MTFKFIGKYTIISFIVGSIDFFLAYFLYQVLGLHYMLASNIGIAVGFLLQFMAGMKYVFKSNSYTKSFVVYIVSLFLGVAVSNLILWFSFNFMKMSFLISKFLSMVLPFFIVYFMRRVMLEVHDS
ncbi:GtrA family protein [Clostridium sp. MT-14]|uniref:GtrA family protein n=1 Tax=Clostridium aromativorans TaxID=2836848 RepID=A0ABS8N4V5_9CLOT|nr:MULTISPECIES: GtrA family protein [Clostridium]MCC9294194.1 GtrA family protein [Clostridium aromativorans]